MPANLENSPVATGLEKGQLSFQSQRKAMPKNSQTPPQLYSSHMLEKFSIQNSHTMLKILQARLQQYVNQALPDVPTGFIKFRGTRDQLPTSIGS